MFRKRPEKEVEGWTGAGVKGSAPRTYFEPRIECCRTVPGGWKRYNQSNLQEVVHEPSDLLSLTGSSLRRHFVNCSDVTVYVFDKCGDVVEELPPTFLNKQVAKYVSPTFKENRYQAPEPPVERDQDVFSHNGQLHDNPPPHFTSAPDTTYASKRMTHPGSGGFEQLSEQYLSRTAKNVLRIQLTRLEPLCGKTEKGQYQGTLSDYVIPHKRREEIEVWDTEINLDELESRKHQFDGCDAVYHPGLDLYFSTNADSKYVGKVDEALFAAITSDRARLKLDNVYPLVVFAHKDVVEDVFYYSNDGRTILAAPIVKSALMEPEKFRIRTTSYIETQKKSVSSCVGVFDFSKDDLRKSDHQAVILDTDYIVGLSLGEVQTFLEKHPLNGLPAKTRIITDISNVPAKDGADIQSLEEQIDDLRHQNRSLGASAETIRRGLDRLTSDVKNGEIETPEELVKSLARLKQSTIVNPDRPTLWSAMNKVEKTTKGLAGVSKNVKEIIIVTTAAVGAAGTLAASISALKHRYGKKNVVIVKEGS